MSWTHWTPWRRKKRLQREEYECNLVAAGLEIEKDTEVRGRKLCILHGAEWVMATMLCKMAMQGA